MRSAFPALAALALLPLAASLSACGDTFGGIDPLIRTDSFTLAAPTGPSGRPSAVDVASNVLLTHPERPAEAGVFDIQVRQNGSTFSLVPSAPVGNLRGAGLQKTTRSIDAPGKAPREVAGYTRTAVTIAAGETYFIQTRPVCSTTSKYGIFKVIEVKPDSGTVTLKLVSNQNCDDERLEP